MRMRLRTALGNHHGPNIFPRDLERSSDFRNISYFNKSQAEILKFDILKFQNSKNRNINDAGGPDFYSELESMHTPQGRHVGASVVAGSSLENWDIRNFKISAQILKFQKPCLSTQEPLTEDINANEAPHSAGGSSDPQHIPGRNPTIKRFSKYRDFLKFRIWNFKIWNFKISKFQKITRSIMRAVRIFIQSFNPRTRYRAETSVRVWRPTLH